MATRRRLCSAAVLGGLAGALPVGLVRAQPPPQEPAAPPRPPTPGDSLPSRGAPTGRIGAATRGDQPGLAGGLALDLVAPLRGVGLCSTDQPTLFWLLSDGTPRPARLTLSTRNQARPLADLDLPRPLAPGLGRVRLNERGVRLAPEIVHVWSVAVPIDPRAPSRDLVGSATILYRPADPALARAVREAPPGRGAALLVEAGYWYDAVALAEQASGLDRGAALAALLEGAGLRPPAAAAPRMAR